MFSAMGDRQILPRQTKRSLVAIGIIAGKQEVDGLTTHYSAQDNPGIFNPLVKVSIRERMVSVDLS
jgi:hypothetical protein